MDIPVSRLNNRMALQLPTELPLGLVFVIGEVCELMPAAGENQPVRFYLREGAHSLPCRLSQRAAADAELEEGIHIRAGGHLAFDPHQAHYYLLARDIELVKERRSDSGGGLRAGNKEERTSFRSILDDVRRRSEATNLAPAELPPWVKQLAPPEIRAELYELEETNGDSAAEFFSDEMLSDKVSTLPDMAAEGDLSDELFTVLSQAMDSEEDVELTPQMIAELLPPSPTVADEPDEAEEPAAASVASNRPEFPPVESVPSPPLSEPINRAFEFLVYGLVLGVSIVLGALLLLLLFWY